MTVDRKTIAILFICEAVALIPIFRLWRSRGSTIISRVAWTIVLLVPFIGVVFYGLMRLNPKSHPDQIGDSTAGYTGHDGAAF
jgi:hypothetical protein